MLHFHSLGGSTLLHEMTQWHLIKNLTPSIDVYLTEESYCQISPQSDLKQPSLRLFWKRSPQQQEQQQKQEQGE